MTLDGARWLALMRQSEFGIESLRKLLPHRSSELNRFVKELLRPRLNNRCYG
jgi:hypothetical protein